MRPDLVYLLRDGESEELRFSLRSVAANLPHGRVWLVGGGPAWPANVSRIRVRQRESKYENVIANLRAALDSPEVSDPFVLMCDDFFVVEQIDSVPVLHCGRLAERLVRDDASAKYQRAMTETLRLLRDLGHHDPLCYDLHTPMTVGKSGMVEALDAAAGRHVLWQTVYGNLTGAGGSLSANVKVPVRRSTDVLPAGPFWSTNDNSFAHTEIGRRIRAAFPERCRYEE